MKYYFSPQMNYETFKLLNDKFGRDEGPTPQNVDKTLHQMLTEDRTINIFLDTEQSDDPLVVTVEDIPEGAEMLTNSPKVKWREDKKTNGSK